MNFHHILDLPMSIDPAMTFYQTSQPHGGVIQKRKEPYTSIIRAKPKTIGRVQDTVIILLGASPHKIKQAVEQARAQNNFVKPQTVPNYVYSFEEIRQLRKSTLNLILDGHVP